MKKDYKTIIPTRFHGVSYDTDVPEYIKEIAGNQFKNKLGLYLYGDMGIGKTHIAYAIVKKLIEDEKEVMCFNTGMLMERLRPSIERENEEPKESIFDQIINFKGVLFLDDLGAEKPTDWVRERLYLIINQKYEDMGRMIFTSNCDMEILSARLGNRIPSRIAEMTELIHLTGANRRFETK